MFDNHGSVETLPAQEEEKKENGPQGRVVPSLSPSDETRLYNELYDEYGHPAIIKLKVAYAYIMSGWAIYMMWATTNPVVFCVAASLAGVVGIAYMLTK